MRIFLEYLKVSLWMLPIILPALWLLPRLSKRYAARVSYVIWLVLAVRLLIPWNLTLPQETAPIHVAISEEQANEWVQAKFNPVQASPSTQQMPLHLSRSQQNCSVMMSLDTNTFEISNIIFCPLFLYQFYCFIPFILLLSGTSKTLAFQKESFWLAKRVLLPCKRSPFEVQNDSFYNPKGIHLISPRISLSLFTTNYSNLTNAAVFIIRVIRAIRVVFLHHEFLESHECSCVYNSFDSRDSCCLSFTTNFPNLTNVAVFYNSCDSCDSCCFPLYHEFLESHECSRVYNSCDSRDSCCLSFTTNFPNLTNVAALLDSCDSCDSCCLSFTTNFSNLTNVAEL